MLKEDSDVMLQRCAITNDAGQNFLQNKLGKLGLYSMYPQFTSKTDKLNIWELQFLISRKLIKKLHCEQVLAVGCILMNLTKISVT